MPLFGEERNIRMRKKLCMVGMAMMLAAAMVSGCGNSKSAEEKTTETKTETMPTVNYGEGLNEDGTLANTEGKDYVTLCDYESIQIPKEEVKAEDSEIENEISILMQSFTTQKQVKDRKVKDGDVVNIDYVGTVDGVEFDGGSAKGYDLTIGSGTFIDGFEDQLVDHVPGDNVEVKVTFPENYASKDLAGKDAVFDTTVNYISESETPALTDEFVKENLSEYGYTSVKNMKKKMREEIENNKKYNYIWTYLVDNSTFETIPEELVTPQLDIMVESLEASLYMQNVTLEDYLTSSGYEDEDGLREAYYSDCEDMIKSYLVADKVAQEKNIKVSEENLADYFKKYYNTEEYSSYVDYYSRAYINRTVLNNLVTETLAKTAKTV